MTGHGQKLSRKKEHAIAALLSQPSIGGAAKKVGIGEKTLFRWLQLEEFQRAYKNARHQVIDQTIAQIQSVMSEAVQTLLNVMSDVAAPASAKVSAARALLDIGFKVVEIEELEGRIEKIEKNL
jgi:transposase-like protein